MDGVGDWRIAVLLVCDECCVIWKYDMGMIDMCMRSQIMN